jgi:hypothetical protein
MAVGSKHLQTQTYTAATSMSAASLQFCFVKEIGVAADGVTPTVGPVTANTDVPLGVLQNSPGSGEMAIVALAGFTKVRVGATDLTGLPRIASDATGRAIAIVAGTSPGFYAAGRIVLTLDAADNDGGLASATINLLNPVRNA